ncbi:deoxyribodipyrimidine photo-lyase [Leifsonia sp. 98AMF]|uniref:cryptochrome/photolyase family protein n=1 Tax=unclassified Leifsonia TaxID=2663824 RepID=UPI00087D3F69|nr:MULTISPECIES: deoxyribodipyrimidine photo-lyase [unclassified Leifsonia]SDH29395.1 deoxyribodipyrimidine photo-lyase [Leifsonia sp. 197AMF]SDJ08225.1 deoxyribodipyrimidine photo-lyase [Leifsonia sp. 466MF]SDJ62874.1 deoxyribodipyrimidine photo-lyase type I [Leifsonia sp. 157MF]SDN29200.1 deoxyribodipyrimidine photo-lyase [Leifsonia sp. 509MF]SEM91877.1 deoxyribodipyrimidine photo-lyase [Leifsonia sp. 467MF]
MSERPAVVWFRDDLRVADNPALHAAVQTGSPVLCVFVWDDETPELRAPGAASRWWLHHSLASLTQSLERLGAGLVLLRGRSETVIETVLRETDASAIFWNRRYGGAERRIDEAVKTAARASGVEAASFAATLLFEPWTIRTGQDTPFSVYTPFWRACLAAPAPRKPGPAPQGVHGGSLPRSLETVTLDELGLLPTHPDWAGGLRETWEPGEKAAHAQLKHFLADDLSDYREQRDVPGVDATSRLSPRLRWGELSPHQVWHATIEKRQGATAQSASTFLSEVGWREFAYHTLFEHPDLATVNIHREYDSFPWPRLHPSALRAWEQGRTGVPLVDAGMRELWRTGVMHNRVRMVTASFLIKNLLIDWRHGEQWFWDTLVDADPANNAFNWQWVAGSGADAAPYFRIFNPELQRQKFDPHGDYVRRWVPEWDTPDYPEPIVDLAETRRAALAAYDVVKRSR